MVTMPTLFLRLAAILALSVAGLIVWCAPVLAHAELSRSEPAAGSALEEVPEQVRLRFTEPVDAEFSPLEVYGPAGQRVDRDNARVDPGDARAVIVDLQDGLSAGSYSVEWRLTSVDGHVVAGEYGFNVTADAGPPEGEGAGEPGGGPEPQSGDEPQQLAEQDTDGGTDQSMLYSALSLGVLGLVAVAILGVARLRGRKP